MASTTLSSNELAHLGLKELMRCYWLDIEGLGLLSMLSVRIRQSASDGRFWRAAVRAVFPRHPFEVGRLTWDVVGLSFGACMYKYVNCSIILLDIQLHCWTFLG